MCHWDLDAVTRVSTTAHVSDQPSSSGTSDKPPPFLRPRAWKHGTIPQPATQHEPSMRTLCNKKGCLAKNEYDKPHPLVAATCNSGNLSFRQKLSGGQIQQLLSGMHINKDQRQPGSHILPIKHFGPHRMTTVQINLQVEKAARDPSKSKARSSREKEEQSIRA